jgi:hypothetical protein
MRPNIDNPLGYWESAALFDFHERVLRAAGSSWDAWTQLDAEFFDSSAAAGIADEFQRLLEQEFGSASLFVVKDPRICRFVPFWLRNLEAAHIDAVAILTLRAPADVASSLMARDGLDRTQSLLIWLRHVLDAEFETRAITRSVVRYRDVLENWKAVKDRISADTGIQWPRSSDAAEQEIAEFLRRDLCHHASGAANIGVEFPLCDWVTRTDDAFQLLLEPHGTRQSEAFEVLDDVRGQLDRAATQFGRALDAERQALRGRVAALDEERQALRGRVAALDEERQALRGRVAALDVQRSELSERSSGLELALNESRALTRDLQMQLLQLRDHAASLELQRDALQTRSADLEVVESGLRTEVGRFQSERDDLVHRSADLEERSRNLERELASVRHHVDALLGSYSWRFTAPFRGALRILMRQHSRSKPHAIPPERDSEGD